MKGNRRTYVAKGNKTSEFYSIDAWGYEFDTLAPIPVGPSGKPPYKGCRGAADGQRFVYMAKGNKTNEFWRYDVATDTWQQLSDVPGKSVRAGADAVYVERNNSGCIYLLKGTGREFCRYDVAAARWESLPNAPAGNHRSWPDGSWLVYDDNSTIYAHKAKYHEFYSFNVSKDSWNPTVLKPMPIPGPDGEKKAGAGGCGAWHETKLYALKGNNSRELWVYLPARDSWCGIDGVPLLGVTGKEKKVKAGADMVSYEAGNVPVVLFLLKGNKTNEFGASKRSTRARAKRVLAPGSWVIPGIWLHGLLAASCQTRFLVAASRLCLAVPRLELRSGTVNGVTVPSRRA